MTPPKERGDHPQADATQRVPFETIIDSSQAHFTGAWSTSQVQPNSFNGTYRITNRSAYSAEPRVASWQPDLPTPGDYTVSIWLPDGNQDRSLVTYRLHHAGEITEFRVDQTRQGGRWEQLGSGPYRFKAAGIELLELRAADVAPNADGKAVYVQADAVRFASPPRNIRAKNAPNFLELSWNTIPGAAAYRIRRKTAGSNTMIEQVVDDTTYLDLDVENNSTYTYEVAGMNAAGAGPASSIVATPPKAAPLQAVQGLKVRTVGRVPILSWLRTADASAYIVERASTSGGKFKAIARITETDFADFLSGETAHYRVRSSNTVGDCALTSWQVSWRRRTTFI
jgi:hypothetical protein